MDVIIVYRGYLVLYLDSNTWLCTAFYIYYLMISIATFF